MRTPTPSTPGPAGIRQTRNIAGVETLRIDGVLNCRKRPACIVRSPWPIELHTGDRPKLRWLVDDF
ncbi:FAD-dependent oxidoreductase [Actinomadura sp. NPDC049753]|uniref:FAD-dependent oxidoreductase n=1 Tax=Actinomadura sp. NPDC049753 TaxID=3154739 RepID=UPI003432FBC3